MKQILIKNAKVVNEGRIIISDVLLKDERIEKIASNIEPKANYFLIDASELYLLPGMIDAHVHFREPGLTRKGTIASESAAAVAGGITSYFEMPNTFPNATNGELLEEKFQLASRSSYANYSFYFGVNHRNIHEALKIDNTTVCGITDDGLSFDDDEGGLCNRLEYLDRLFADSSSLIALHCEDEQTIRINKEIYQAVFPLGIPHKLHAVIRSEDACVQATERVIALAQKHNTRLHILHVSTEKEAALIGHSGRCLMRRITGEVCIHHLYFSEEDYSHYGSEIIWNPSIKSELNRKGLFKALNADFLDIVATDHAPHLLDEKSGDYLNIKPGAPSVQHALQALLHLYDNSEKQLPFLAAKTSHNVAELFKVKERGYIREGYYADLVLVNLNYDKRSNRILYKCGWSPFSEINFGNRIEKTFVNGHLVYDQGVVLNDINGKRITFDKIR